MRSDAPLHDDYAEEYDNLTRAYRWWGHDALFGLCYEYVRPGDRLLDVGIGTGLSSLPFARAGLQVYGCDESAKMLEVCRAKGLAADLRQVGIGSSPWPYADGFFHHVVACGVFHFMGDLEPVFGEIARIARPGATLAFTTRLPDASGETKGQERYAVEEAGGGRVYLHSQRYVADLLARRGFAQVKELRLQAMTAGGRWDATYALCVALKNHGLTSAT